MIIIQHDNGVGGGFVTDMKSRKRGKTNKTAWYTQILAFFFVFATESQGKYAPGFRHGSQQGAKIPAHVAKGGGWDVSIQRKGLRHPGIRSSTHFRRQIRPEDGSALHDVSGTGAQATRPPTRGSASPETEKRTDDLKPRVGPCSIGTGSDVRFVMVIYDRHTQHTAQGGGSVSAPATLLARPVNLRVHHTHVSSECVIATEGLLFCAQMASHLLLARVVDRILMASQVVRP